MGRGQIRWTQAQQERLLKAVRVFNATITRMENSGLYDVVPNRVTFGEEMNRIQDRDQLYQREKELKRITKKSRKDAQDVVEVDGVTMPKYLIREYKNSVRLVNRRREELRDKIAPGLLDMTKPEQAHYYSNKNIKELPDYLEDPHDYADGLDEINYEKYYSDLIYFDNYITTLEKNFPRVYDIIGKQLVDIKDIPGAMREIMESPDIEKEIDYLYPGKDMTEYQRKEQALLTYWEMQWNKYVGDR